MEQRFTALCLRLGIQPYLVRTTWCLLQEHYSETHRHYHHLAHIEAMLAWLDSCTPDNERIELAIWFHDVIYDPKSAFNEENSARFFETCFGSSLRPGLVEDVVRLIMATKHGNPRTGPIDENLISDIDLTILAAAHPNYEAYRLAIRREYSHVPQPDYIRGRGAVLSHFLQSPIFVTGPFQHLEDRARQNILAELRQLEVADQG